MRLNNYAIPLDSNNAFIVVTNHQLDLPVDLETCACLENILLLNVLSSDSLNGSTPLNLNHLGVMSHLKWHSLAWVFNCARQLVLQYCLL